MVSSVRPLSWDTRPLTFSITISGVWWCAAMRSISGNIFPRSSSKPPRRPVMLKAWQGNPPSITSCGGTSSAGTSTMERRSTLRTKFASCRSAGYLSNSLA